MKGLASFFNASNSHRFFTAQAVQFTVIMEFVLAHLLLLSMKTRYDDSEGITDSTLTDKPASAAI